MGGEHKDSAVNPREGGYPTDMAKEKPDAAKQRR
jgi:hypothetical protein